MLFISTSGVLGRYISLPPPVSILIRSLIALFFITLFAVYNKYTFKVLRELDIKYSFIFNSKEITPFILKNRKHLIPRFDCNEFI